MAASRSIPVENLTAYPGAEVRRIVRWVFRELDLGPESGGSVRVSYTRGSYYAGHFNRESREISARVPRPGCGCEPHNRGLRGGPPEGIYPADWREALVAIVAHEAQHLRQHLGLSTRKAKFSEVEAEWAEYGLWRRWREEGHGLPSRLAAEPAPRGNGQEEAEMPEKKEAPKRKPGKAPTTLEACKGEMGKHEEGYRAYMAARRVKKQTQPSSAEHKTALADMKKHNAAYTTYWRAYTAGLKLGLPKRQRKPKAASAA